MFSAFLFLNIEIEQKTKIKKSPDFKQVSFPLICSKLSTRLVSEGFISRLACGSMQRSVFVTYLHKKW